MKKAHFLPLLATSPRGVNLPLESVAVDANKQTNARGKKVNKFIFKF